MDQDILDICNSLKKSHQDKNILSLEFGKELSYDGIIITYFPKITANAEPV